MNFSVTAGITLTLSLLLRPLPGPPPLMAAVAEIPLMDAMLDILLAAVEDIPLKTAIADIVLTAAMADISVTVAMANILPTTAMAVPADPPLTTTMALDILVAAMEDIRVVAMEDILPMAAMVPDILLKVAVANILPTTTAMADLADPPLTTTMAPDILVAAMEDILVVAMGDILQTAAMAPDILLTVAVADILLMGAATKIPPPLVGQADLRSCVILRLSRPWVPTPSKSYACPSPRRNWAVPLRTIFS